MTRSGFSKDGDYDPLAEGRWIAARKAAFNGKRGQAFFRELLTALDAMPEKRLIAEDLETRDGAVCAIGAVGKSRGIDMKGLDPEECHDVARAFGISPTMVQEIVFQNDDDFEQHVTRRPIHWVQSEHDQDWHVWPIARSPETPEQRYLRMVKWVRSQLSGTPK